MRHRLPIVLLAMLCATLAGQALAPGASRTTARTAAKDPIRLPDGAKCLKRSSIRIVFRPPAGASFAAISVRVGASEVLQVAGLTGAGTMVIPVPRDGGARVSVTGSTTTG